MSSPLDTHAAVWSVCELRHCLTAQSLWMWTQTCQLRRNTIASEEEHVWVSSNDISVVLGVTGGDWMSWGEWTGNLPRFASATPLELTGLKPDACPYMRLKRSLEKPWDLHWNCLKPDTCPYVRANRTLEKPWGPSLKLFKTWYLSIRESQPNPWETLGLFTEIFKNMILVRTWDPSNTWRNFDALHWN